jgi:hypothetical protein
LGSSAGSNITTGDRNIDIGNVGDPADSSGQSGFISMNVMSRVEASGAIDPRFQRLFLETDFSLGRCPRL